VIYDKKKYEYKFVRLVKVGLALGKKAGQEYQKPNSCPRSGRIGGLFRYFHPR